MYNSAAYVNEQIELLKQKDIPLADKVWQTGLLCVGWPYIFGDRGASCTVAHRQSKDLVKYPKIKEKCQVLNGSKSSCTGCKWYPNGKRVLAFDCRGYTYWCLLKYGIKLIGVGATSQWKEEGNWDAKGTMANLPKDKLVCLFYTNKKDPNVMEHTGFGYKGETLECSAGVEHHVKTDAKWEYWALPKGLYSGESPIIPPVDPTVKLPTLRKGDKNQYVVILQEMLLARGYKLPKYGADGSFGNETLAAVKQFQQDWGLTVDGVVGAKTWEMLETSPEKPSLYTVTIPHLSKEMADDLLTKYVGTMTIEK